MTEAALSINSSSLATLVPVVPGLLSDSGAMSATAQSSDPFAALLATASGSKAPVISTAAPAGNVDPVSALLASAATLPAINPAASVSPVVAAPTFSSASVRPIPAAAVTPIIASGQPAAAEALSAETDPVLLSTGSKDSDDAEADADDKDRSQDPLADAIASGATAVLALAPTIVAAPVQAPPSVETQIKIDAGIAPLPAAKLAALAGRPESARFNTIAEVLTSTETKPQPVAETIELPTSVPTGPSPEQMGSDAPKPQAARADAQPSVELAPELADAVIATLKRSDVNEAKPSQIQPIGTDPSDQEASRTVMAPAQRGDEPVQSATQPKATKPTATAPTVIASKAAPSEATPPHATTREAVRTQATPPAVRAQEIAQPAVTTQPPSDNAAQDIASSETAAMLVSTPIETAKKADAPRAAKPAVQQGPQPQTASVQRPQHRRADDLSVPGRPADTRKRVETAAAEPFVSGSGQQAAEPVKSAPVVQDMADAAQVKGDTVIEQTLTIARDGAWLDRLAHDIARSAGNDGNLQFKLNPQHLGALSVAISQIADGASIRMTADHETTRNILLDAQPRLIAEAQAHGIRISESHVELNQNPPQKQDQGQTQSQNQGNHQSANQDMSRWAQGGAGQNGMAQNGQNRQSSPSHQPFVSNLGRKAEVDPESAGSDSDGLYA